MGLACLGLYVYSSEEQPFCCTICSKDSCTRQDVVLEMKQTEGSVFSSLYSWFKLLQCVFLSQSPLFTAERVSAHKYKGPNTPLSLVSLYGIQCGGWLALLSVAVSVQLYK